MKAYLIRRIIHSLFAVFGVLLVVFLLVRLTPGDPALLLLPDLAPPDAVVALRKELGLDRSIFIQFWIFLQHVVRGNLGQSIFFPGCVKAGLSGPADHDLFNLWVFPDCIDHLHPGRRHLGYEALLHL